MSHLARANMLHKHLVITAPEMPFYEQQKFFTRLLCVRAPLGEIIKLFVARALAAIKASRVRYLNWPSLPTAAAVCVKKIDVLIGVCHQNS
jgi:hypothetical protein